MTAAEPRVQMNEAQIFQGVNARKIINFFQFSDPLRKLLKLCFVIYRRLIQINLTYTSIHKLHGYEVIFRLNLNMYN